MYVHMCELRLLRPWVKPDHGVTEQDPQGLTYERNVLQLWDVYSSPWAVLGPFLTQFRS